MVATSARSQGRVEAVALPAGLASEHRELTCHHRPLISITGPPLATAALSYLRLAGRCQSRVLRERGMIWLVLWIAVTAYGLVGLSLILRHGLRALCELWPPGPEPIDAWGCPPVSADRPASTPESTEHRAANLRLPDSRRVT
jgi:hypothetical protein